MYWLESMSLLQILFLKNYKNNKTTKSKSKTNIAKRKRNKWIFIGKHEIGRKKKQTKGKYLQEVFIAKLKIMEINFN